MTHLTDTATRRGAGLDAAALDRTDRLLLGGAAVAWLGALGAGVAATVALADLARGHSAPSADTGTPWILYTIIGVSAAVIVGAVPLLLRARRTSEDEPPSPVEQRLAQQAGGRPSRAVDAPTEKMRAPSVPSVGTNSGRLPRILQSPMPAVPDSPVVDRLWLRNTAAVVASMGVATLLISAGTYLMAVDSGTVGWVLYGVAGAVTVGMGAITWYFLRELRAATTS